MGDKANEEVAAATQEPADLVTAFEVGLEEIAGPLRQFYTDNLAASARRDSALKHLETSFKFALETAAMYGITPVVEEAVEDVDDGDEE